MKMRDSAGTFVAAVVLLLIAAATAPAALPFVPFVRIEADPKKAYPATKENGPWMIMAAAFRGEGAERDAHELVIELRKRYKLEAYTHSKVYDYTTRSMPGLGVDPYGRPVRMMYENEERVNEVAVLVGNFPSVEDSRVQKTLAKIKYAQPACLQRSRRPAADDRFATFKEFQKRLTPNKEAKKKGPLGSAFATRNPALPAEYFNTPGLSKFVVDMNKGVTHSLLDCKGKYTVKVATYRGNQTIDQREIRDITRGGKKMKSRLEQAAINAHKVTETLRKIGWEAYEFHDRSQSIVTVGSFNTVGMRGLDGKVHLDPKVEKIINAFAIQTRPVPGRAVIPRPRHVEGIPLDGRPEPLVVPRKSIGADYAKGRLPW